MSASRRNAAATVADLWYHRQRYQRHSAVQRIGLIHIGASKEPAMIRSLSARGLVAQLYRDVSPGEQILVELQPGQRIEGHVVGARDWTLDIAFSTPVDVEQILAQPWVLEVERQSRPPRFAVNCPGRLMMATKLYRIRLRNISNRGARIEALKPFSRTGPFVLELPDLPPLRGSIRWQQDTAAGLAFDEEIPAPVLAEWLKRRG